MVERGEEYAADLDRSSVSRWESGARLAPREFLVAFGRSLRVPEPEMDRMLSLAGYDVLGDEEGRAAILAAAQSVELQVESLQREVHSLIGPAGTSRPPVNVYGVARDALRKAALPGAYALLGGLGLHALGANRTPALLAYVLVGFAIVIGQWAVRSLRPNRDSTERDHVGDLFFTSLLFTLNASLLIGAFDKTDHFGFYTIEAITNTPMSFLLTILSHLALSLAASIMFSVLWTRQHGLIRSSAFERAVWTTLPPILFAYVSITVFTNLGAWFSLMVVFGILLGAFTTIVALNEPGVALAEVGLVLKAAVAVIGLLCTVGAVGSLIAYLDPSMLIATFEFRIIPLRVVSVEELGYTPEEKVKLMRMGHISMYLAYILYLATVVGGYLLITIRRAAS